MPQAEGSMDCRPDETFGETGMVLVDIMRGMKYDRENVLCNGLGKYMAKNA